MPPMLSDTDKFDGTNWPTWSNHILSIAALKGVVGYLDGTIKDPMITTSTPTTSPQPETPWNSLLPTIDEWEARNAWTKILLTFNTKNPVGLGINISSSAAEAWETYKSGYEATSDIARQNAEQELRNLAFSDGDDFQTHVTIMQNKLSQARALGADITSKNFKTILLNSLSTSWDPVIASLYKDIPVSETISQFQVWWLRINQNRPVNSPQAVTALQTTSHSPRDQTQIICTNPNCRRCGHTIEVCYWPGEGKEGQFPPGFGHRGGTRGTATNTREGNYRPRPTINNTTTKDAEDKEVFALMTMDNVDFEVTTSPSPSTPRVPDKPTINSYNTTNSQGHEMLGM